MNTPHGPADQPAEDASKSSGKKGVFPGHAKRKGRVAAEDGGGTNPQNERRRLIREHLAEQYYKGARNPELRFKGPEELAAEHGVDEKTIRTDIAYLRDREGLPVWPIRKRGGYGFTEEVKAFSGDEFTRGEYLALWMSVQSFEAWGGLPQQKKLPRIMRKLKAGAGTMNPEQLRRMRECITFKAGGFQAPVEQGIFDTVLRALLEREELTFGYVSLTKRREALATGGAKAGKSKAGGANTKGGSPMKGGASAKHVAKSSVMSAEVFGVPEKRRVQPLHLLCWEYAWYLFAWDPARGGIRTFALGRMSDVELTGTHFTPEVKFNLRKELSKSFGITRGKKAVRVHLRFQPRAVPLVIERLWHPSQEMIENEDLTLDLTMQVAITPELVRWVQSWGGDVAVLAPTALDNAGLEECRRRLEAAARRRGMRWEIGA